ncbi:MAG TPA: RnfABCDGE type electron transport complex subunit G [Anaerovoracaceae bacterium]|nr:RnfABCDGE type electron transport complex subunit G [Anaerovoracaceae bacterium]
MTASERKDMIGPTLVLFLICLVITGALAITYQVTKPLIDEINIKNANLARGEVLPDAEGSFTEIDAEMLPGITEIYNANNETGYVFTAIDKGFGGEVIVMTGIDENGEITGVKVTSHSETPGLGTKAMTVDYLSQYRGQVSITRTNESDKVQIDAVTGATVSSEAIFRAVDTSLSQYEKIGGGKQ